MSSCDISMTDFFFLLNLIILTHASQFSRPVMFSMSVKASTFTVSISVDDQNHLSKLSKRNNLICGYPRKYFKVHIIYFNVYVYITFPNGRSTRLASYMISWYWRGTVRPFIWCIYYLQKQQDLSTLF